MKIGIIADTHDNHPAIHEAINQFISLDTEIVLHAGDITTTRSLWLFCDLPCDMIGVFGNCDHQQKRLRDESRKCGTIRLESLAADLSVESLRIGMVHGDDPGSVLALAEMERFDIIISGHTHRPSVKRVGEILMINPGEACGERYGKATVAILDTDTLDAEILPLQFHG
ncbi:metallophosphoesterase [Methanocalculus taiwanensis]|uniref:Phosphoesterase n=1 Tax=Methanocalculus taiwanensis TaxID=106207 RepID=A0ABD4TIY6_9EURY|nr:metallophosphoesterase [Methanocalculus taiwanensis]MCQ1538716.1 metallophosphoesterase [Methanocalculus taiwanensis]